MFSVVIGKVGKVIPLLRSTYFSQKETRKQSHMGFVATSVLHILFSSRENEREKKPAVCGQLTFHENRVPTSGTKRTFFSIVPSRT